MSELEERNIIERLKAVHCIVSLPCDKESAQCAYDELDAIIPYIEKSLSLIQIEVDCPECIKYVCQVCHNENKCGGDAIDCPCCNNIGFLYGKWDKNTFYVCDTCKGTGKITKTPESGDRGEII